MVIKERNNVTFGIGQYDNNTRGYVVIDHNPNGDEARLPLSAPYKMAKQLFCLMNNYSMSNPSR
jgi:hypothetical protein